MTTHRKLHDSLCNPDEFTITYELVPGPGSSGRRIERLLEFAASAHQDGRIKALSITDNPGGHPALAPEAIGSEVRRIGIEPLIHFSLKDKNRNQVESQLFHHNRQHFRTLLIMGGDYPRSAYYGQAKPVYDLDSVQMLRLMKDMEEGNYQKHFKGSTSSPERLSMYGGCVVSPFKTTQIEQYLQYGKLIKKVRAGARFIVTQLGYDCLKFTELMEFTQRVGINVPILANVFIPSLGVARIMARGKIPGIVFPERLLQCMEEEKKTGQGEEQRLERGAKLIVVLRSMGYSGVHIGGNNLDFDKVCYLLNRAEELWEHRENLHKDVHFPVKNTWYSKDESQLVKRYGPHFSSGKLHNIIHNFLFAPKGKGARLFGKFCRLCGSASWSNNLFIFIEAVIKKLLFSCQMCGDCTLAYSAYLCPQSGCPKKLLNGPCGGSRHNYCEVYPDRYCFWVKVYRRLGDNVEIEQLGNEPILPPKDWSLENSSSWINYFCDQGHVCLSKQKEFES
ncbi:MAG: methylenetetrahydrofolate reductase C-terminal domain-containing protein [Desulfobulbaceae bacterium]|nr:methylenetetrahydrofolate reductase C-terminal domain-containing protein [Desulfobulbaceae bacterium]